MLLDIIYYSILSISLYHTLLYIIIRRPCAPGRRSSEAAPQGHLQLCDSCMSQGIIQYVYIYIYIL